jgi:hypothetical protein
MKIEDGSVEVKSAISNLRLSLSKSLSTVAKALEKEATSSMIDWDSSIVLERDRHIDMSHIEDDDSSGNQNEMPLFENVMACSTSTVPEILLEWEVGINGKPSVTHANATWKTKWRMGTKNQKQYSRRKLIINMICRYASRKRLSKEAAAEIIEEKRIMNKLSLLQLADKWQSFEKVVLV